MLRFITETYHRLLEEVSLSKTRYLYSSFEINNRLTGLIGPRGVGKTTLLLQYIKSKLSKETTFYFSADLVYFQQSNLLEFVNHLHQVEGYKVIFIDEIHKYQNWNQELKNIYDAFPTLKIVFSGSSMLDLISGSHDLSRRAKLYHLHGLSFREYLNFSLGFDFPTIPFKDLLSDPIGSSQFLKGIDRILPLFSKYLHEGYYPFVFEDPHSYHEKITRIIDKTISEDIASFYNLKTPNLPYFKKVLTYLASIPPGELNIHNLSGNLGIDNKTVEHYLKILASVGLARELYLFEGGGSSLRKASKLLLNNTNLIHTMQQYLGQEISKGMEREIFFVQTLQNAGIDIFYSKQGDYQTRDAIFEIGGKNKNNKQLKGSDLPGFLAKDDILTPIKNEIPLFLFGFIY